MKMILAIVNKEDVKGVCKVLKENDVRFTRFSSTGGFLREGNTTLMIAADEADVPAILDYIKDNCSTREQSAPAVIFGDDAAMPYTESEPIQVTVGGATVFVLDLKRTERM